LKKWERKTPSPFSQSCSEKGGEAVEGCVSPKIIVTIHTGFATFTAFPPVALIKMSVFSLSHLSRWSDKKRHIDRALSRHPQHRKL
jgi:hypothetical protein